MINLRSDFFIWLALPFLEGIGDIRVFDEDSIPKGVT